MKTEMGLIDKVIVIDGMLNKLGYDTSKMTMDEMLDIKNAIEKAVVKAQLPVKGYEHPSKVLV